MGGGEGSRLVGFGVLLSGIPNQGVLKVNTNIPTISILLSKDPLDTSDASYQAPGTADVVWGDRANFTKKVNSHRKMVAIKDFKNAASKPKRSRGNGKDGFKSKKSDALQNKTDPQKS
ncbi:hypothetical protein Btru_060618 [Bulinus truncatus]|nr:hypothetical protein Btru_060618 [Bulinus truncatus]